MKPKNETEVVEYSRDKKIADPDSLVLDGGSATETVPSIKAETPPQSIDEFVWRDNEDCVVVQHQPAIAIHLHSDGSVCIRQEDFWGDRDQVVYFFPEHAETIAEAILALAKRAR